MNEAKTLIDALQWHIDEGIDMAIDDSPVNRLQAVPPITQEIAPPPAQSPEKPSKSEAFSAQKEKAVQMAKACTTLDALRQAIADYDGLDVKRTATNMVFADGHANARVMVIGEAPGADEDRQGVPFVGVSGQLLDKMFACIDLARNCEHAAQALYISNILNWRPPGNRTPTAAEISLALPFIERHIALVNPQFLVLAGAVAAKSVLDMDQSISRLRGKLFDYTPITEGITEGLEISPIKAMATYHPSYLLRTPAQKRKSWQDLLDLKDALSVS